MIRRTISLKPKGIRIRKFSDIYNPTVFDVSYGPLGRAANSGITATVFGAYGLIGKYFLYELGSSGSRAYVPFRGCEMEVRHLKPMFDLGQLGLMPFSPRDDESIIQSIKNSDVVINLIGKYYETKHIVPTRRPNGKISNVNYDLHEVNVEIPAKIAKLCKAAGVKSLIHVSALSANLESESNWNRTKALGEIAVRAEFPESIIVKPATIFGAEDRFLNWIAEFIKKFEFFPLINNGDALVQPVFAVDVAKALMTIVRNNQSFAGQTFQLAGPAEYTYKEVVEFVSDITARPTTLVNVPEFVGKWAGTASEYLISPVITRDSVVHVQEDVILKNDPSLLTFSDLNFEPASMDRVSFDFLHRFRRGGHFILVKGYH